jgi:hypothetical protein
MGRKKIYRERIITPVTEGTTALIDAAKRSGEARADFIRRAIQHELQRETRARLKAVPRAKK